MPSQIEVARSRVLSEIDEATQKRRAIEIQIVSLQHFLELLDTPAKAEASKPRGKPGSVEQTVLKVFADKPGGIAVDDLVSGSGCAASSVRAVLRRLVAAGTLTREGDLYRRPGDLLATAAS